MRGVGEGGIGYLDLASGVRFCCGSEVISTTRLGVVFVARRERHVQAIGHREQPLTIATPVAAIGIERDRSRRTTDREVG